MLRKKFDTTFQHFRAFTVHPHGKADSEQGKLREQFHDSSV